MFTKLSFLVFIFVPLFGNGQIQINCGSIKQFIPHFIAGDGQVLPHQLLVEKKIIEPITSSSSEFEIRLIYFQETHEITTIIHCVNNAVEVSRYDAFATPSREILKEDLSSYTNLGTYTYNNDSTWVLLYKKVANVRPASGYSWNAIFAGLVKNHFFDLPSQAVLDKMARKENPKVGRPWDSDVEWWYEIKIGNHYRYMSMTGDYDGVTSTAKYVRYKQNIANLLLIH